LLLPFDQHHYSSSSTFKEGVIARDDVCIAPSR
jgi:hypothetical protein